MRLKVPPAVGQLWRRTTKTYDGRHRDLTNRSSPPQLAQVGQPLTPVCIRWSPGTLKVGLTGSVRGSQDRRDMFPRISKKADVSGSTRVRAQCVVQGRANMWPDRKRSWISR